MTFGCRVGPVANSTGPAATLVQACSDQVRGPIHGEVLSREQALAHPWLPKFWEVVDIVLTNDPTVQRAPVRIGGNDRMARAREAQDLVATLAAPQLRPDPEQIAQAAAAA